MAWVDPVCGMSVERDDAPRGKLNNVEYRFCSKMCRDAFAERPGRYLKGGDDPSFAQVWSVWIENNDEAEEDER